jgi:transcriptional regulator with XRE-family HTH domain
LEVQKVPPRGARDAEAELGSTVRALRLAKGISQVDLAERANVSLGALKALEGGRGSTTKTLSKVLSALGEDGWVARIAPTAPEFNPLSLLDPRPTTRRARRRAPRRARRAEP